MAADVDPANLPVLTPPETDMSVRLLERVFGPNWGAPFSDEYVAANNVLFDMLVNFNWVVLAAVGIMTIYVLGMGAIGSAHEGKPLGEKYHTLWTPLRFVFTIALLTPVPGAKLSLLQCLILLSTYHGVGGASYLLNQAADGLYANRGAIIAPRSDFRPEKFAFTILSSEVIGAYDALILDSTPPERKWERVEKGDGPAGVWRMKYRMGDAVELGVDDNEYGFVDVPCEDLDAEYCATRVEAVETLQAAAALIAEDLVKASSDRYPNADIPSIDNMLDALREYQATDNEVYTAVLELQSEGYEDDIKTTTEMIKSIGWIGLGSWYWTISGYQEKAAALKIEYPVAEITGAEAIADLDLKDLDFHIASLNKYRERTQAVIAYNVEQLQDAARTGTDSGPFWRWIQEMSSKYGFGMLIDQTIDGFTSGDPIANLQATGHWVITIAESMVAGYIGAKVGAKVIAKGAEAANESLLGKALNLFTGVGKFAQGAAETTGYAFESVAVVFWMLLIPLFMAALALAYYLPMVPFVIWTSGVISWFVLVFEALVAAPVWAASHAVPEGEGIAGQHGRQGYMLFLGILLRPALMTFGFFLSFNLVVMIGDLIGESLKIYRAAMGANYVTGIITMIAFLVIIASITVMYAHKIFSLITWLPDNVMKWANINGNSLGELEDAQNFRGAVGVVTSKSEGAVNTAATVGARKPGAGGDPKADEKEKAAGGAVQTQQQSNVQTAPGTTTANDKSV